MGKDFFEVFPTLKLDEKMRFLLQGVTVTKVTTNSARDFIKVHIFSTHLLQKQFIYKMEKNIKEQLFGKTMIQVEILEEYQLSKQYTPENLMREYHDSILLELGRKSAVEKAMFENADCDFEEGVLCLKLQDSIVAEGKQTSIVNLLSDIFNERFHIPVQIRVSYLPKKKKSALEFNEMQLEAEIEQIVERNAALHKEKMKKQEQKEEKEEVSSEGKEQKTQPKNEKRFDKGQKSSFGKRDFRKSDDPNMIYGRDFDDNPIELSQVVGEMGEITIRGKVISFDTREIRNEKTILMFAVTDFTDTIMVKMFTRNEFLPELLGEIKKGAFLKIKGVTTIDKFDGELTIGSVTGIRKINDFTTQRKDLHPEKRVELHCHTKMSDMDGVSEVKDIVKRAHDWGHKAIAITDHGVVQAFPDANHYIETLDKDDPFKIIYGVEAYLVDDLTEIAQGVKEDRTLDGTFVVFDLETTGFSPIQDKIIEIGAVKVEKGKITDRFSTFVNPQVPIPFEITKLTSITDEMVEDAETIETILPQFLEFIDGAPLVAHNAGFDVGFMEQNCRYQDITPNFVSIDTVALARVLLPTLSKYKLNVVAKALNISLENHHRAVDDAGATAEIFVKFIEMLKERNITTLKGINQFGSMNPEAIRKLPSHHAVILAKNETGRVNLYRLVSMAHLNYFARMPRIPKSEFLKYREGLLIGSA